MDHQDARGGFHRAGPYTLLSRQTTVSGAEVFAARSADGRLVTVTVATPELAAAPGFRDRLRETLDVVRTVSGAFVAPVLDADPDASAPWLATEFMAGVPLRQAVERHGPLPEPALRSLADGIARTLAAVHAAGTVHGDVSPDSVLLVMDGPRIAALGFGGAATDAQTASPTSDMFALGATVLFAASGHEPSVAGAVRETPAAATPEADLGVLPLSLREVIGGCLYPEAQARPTAQQLIDYLRRQELPVPEGSWLPPAVTASLAAVIAAAGSPQSADAGHGQEPPARGAGTGVSRRKVVLALAGSAAVLGGVTAAALSAAKSPSPASGSLPGGHRPTTPASPTTARTTSSPSPSSPKAPQLITLAAPDARPAWTTTGKHAVTCLAASDTVVMAVTATATFFMDVSTGKPAFPAQDTTAAYVPADQMYPTAYAGGVFYLLCDTPHDFGLLAAFDSADGKVKWANRMTSADTGGSTYIARYVAVSANTVYVCGQLDRTSSAPDGPRTGYIRAFDAATGKGLWQVKGTDIDNVLVPPTGSRLLAASAVPGRKTGQVQMIDAGHKGARGWRTPIANGAYYFNPGWPLTCYAAGLFVFAGGEGNTLFAVDPATGAPKWHQRFDAKSGDLVELGNPFPSLDGVTVYVPVGSDLAALSAADGALLWVATLTGGGGDGTADMFKASIRMSGRSAWCSADTVFATDEAKTLWAIDAATGKARWKYTDPGQPDVGFQWTVGGDRVFIASNLTLTAIPAHGG